MAQIWFIHATGRWELRPLVEPVYALRAATVPPVCVRTNGMTPSDAVVTRHDETWVAMAAAPGAVVVNGQPLFLGLRVLRDRDELLVCGRVRLYFSTESLPQVLPLPDVGRSVICPRCQQPITPGLAAVKCPKCATFHHQTDELPCWTYTPTCVLCDQPTDLNAGYRWTPAELEI